MKKTASPSGVGEPYDTGSIRNRPLSSRQAAPN